MRFIREGGMDLLGLLLFSTVGVAAPAAACPAPPPVYVAVLLDDAAVETRTDFSLAQIEAMRQQTGGTERHPTLGFYGHRFGYTVKVALEPATDNSPCAKSVMVSVHMVLSQRIIEIGRELANNPCLFAIAAAHYQLHATVDDGVFNEYAHLVTPALHAVPLVPQQDDYAADKLDTTQIEQLVHASIDASLVPYDAARRAAQLAVDSKTEAQKMTTGCTAPAPHGGHA
jgi:hypothetical protein